MPAIRNLVLVLGDQLTPTLSSLAAADPARDLVLMAEVHSEATYVRHHKKKIALVFSAMRHFAEELRGLGWRVVHRLLSETGSDGSLAREVAHQVRAHEPERIVVTEPGEWRLAQEFAGWQQRFNRPVDVLPDTRFVITPAAFAHWAKGRKQLRMEYFYRAMRQQTGLLIEADGTPTGGQWNFDHDNRKPAARDLLMPKPLRVEPDAITREVLALVRDRFADHFGDLDPFWFAVTRADAERAADQFMREALPSFGDYQDAMLTDERFLYHSILSPYLNCGLLDPLDLCRRAEAAYRAGKAPLNAVEGYIRQIIGWREYVRGIYWLKMPDYVSMNALDQHGQLPASYWTANTHMACLRAAITQTKEEAYAHHIQRLMVTGNFALLAGVDPHAVHEWYLMVYADAYEWVELPNTLGMSQFGDGGLLASKPYAASGAYINRMSDHCKDCRYDVKQRTSADACPFNALYWDFLARHRETLARNPRMLPIYRSYDRFGPDEQSRIRARAADLRARIDTL